MGIELLTRVHQFKSWASSAVSVYVVATNYYLCGEY